MSIFEDKFKALQDLYEDYIIRGIYTKEGLDKEFEEWIHSKEEYSNNKELEKELNFWRELEDL